MRHPTHYQANPAPVQTYYLDTSDPSVRTEAYQKACQQPWNITTVTYADTLLPSINTSSVALRDDLLSVPSAFAFSRSAHGPVDRVEQIQDDPGPTAHIVVGGCASDDAVSWKLPVESHTCLEAARW